MSKKFIFSSAEDEILIDEIQKNKVIFDSSDLNHKDKIMKDSIWTEIGIKLNRNIDDCKKRWKNMRDIYMRQKKNCLLGQLLQIKKKWPLMDHLSFLETVEYERKDLFFKSRKYHKVQKYTNPNVEPASPGFSQYNSPQNQYPPAGNQNQYPPVGVMPGQQCYGHVIQHQPGAYQPSPQVVADGWMPIPQAIPQNSPNGLQYLSTVNQLFVKQQAEIIEALLGFETNNKYTIKNNVGQKVFYAVEDNDCCTRNSCGPIRPFEMKILDNYNNEVIHLSRPLACQSCCFPCCLQKIEVFSPPGCLVGSVEQDWSILTPIFTIRNADNEEVFKIKGPICQFSMCCANVEFKILSKDKTTVVGCISKQWSGILREVFTDADFFGISFPIDLDVRMKAVMLGACFLIDFMFYEK